VDRGQAQLLATDARETVRNVCGRDQDASGAGLDAGVIDLELGLPAMDEDLRVGMTVELGALTGRRADQEQGDGDVAMLCADETTGPRCSGQVAGLD
jgi:hypothetical protein